MPRRRVVSIECAWEDERDLTFLGTVLALLNRYYIARGMAEPLDLTTTDVRYEREPMGQERWLTLPLLEESGVGDCEDLAAATVASYPGIGRVVVVPVGPRVYHALVEGADGRFLDPSRILGMEGT